MGKRAALLCCRCRCSHKSTTRSHPTRSSSPTTPPAQPRAVAPARPRISQTSCGRQWCAASSAPRVFPFSAANHASFSAVQFRAAFACGEWSCHAVPRRAMPCHAVPRVVLCVDRCGRRTCGRGFRTSVPVACSTATPSPSSGARPSRQAPSRPRLCRQACSLAPLLVPPLDRRTSLRIRFGALCFGFAAASTQPTDRSTALQNAGA